MNFPKLSFSFTSQTRSTEGRFVGKAAVTCDTIDQNQIHLSSFTFPGAAGGHFLMSAPQLCSCRSQTCYLILRQIMAYSQAAQWLWMALLTEHGTAGEELALNWCWMFVFPRSHYSHRNSGVRVTQEISLVMPPLRNWTCSGGPRGGRWEDMRLPELCLHLNETLWWFALKRILLIRQANQMQADKRSAVSRWS